MVRSTWAGGGGRQMWPMLLWAKVTSKEAHSGEGGINGELYRVVPGPERRSGTCVGTTREEDCWAEVDCTRSTLLCVL